MVFVAMPLAARTERALLDAFGLENTAEGRRALVASLRTAADDVDSSEGAPPPGRAPPLLEAESVSPSGQAQTPKQKRHFDVTDYPSAHVALRVMYAGWDYHGFAQQGAEASGVATVEGALFAALKRTKLIAHDASWDTVEYTRCGRTDAGVSALGQIVSLKLRSKGRRDGDGDGDAKKEDDNTENENTESTCGADGDVDDGTKSSRERRQSRKHPPCPPLPQHEHHEIDYVTTLNRALPDDIRVLGWSYVDKNFSARFDCAKRVYKYFFLKFPDDGSKQSCTNAGASSGGVGLDLSLMRDAASRFEGTHDFRNVCKMDARNVHNYRREVYKCEIVDCLDETEWTDGGAQSGAGAVGFIGGTRMRNQSGVTSSGGTAARSPPSPGAPPGLCYIKIEGSAFLWHQVRCIATVLFLVGLGREKPDVVDALLDVTKTPRKPQYEMAPDEPLVLWRCEFPENVLSLTMSAAARTQAQTHAAKNMATQLRRAGVWAETWCDLRTDTVNGEDTNLHDVAGDVVAAVCALSAPGRVAGGNAAAKAAHVPLLRRATEPTYEERRKRLVEKEKDKGGDTRVE